MNQRLPYGARPLLETLQQLVAIRATNVEDALNQAADLLTRILGADKVDVFLYQPADATLVAVGTSHTPMGQQEKALGLDRLPVVNGGRTVEVFQSGTSFLTGEADCDPQVLLGVRQALGVRSMMLVPIKVGETRRGVLSVVSAQPQRYTPAALQFLEAVAHWVGVVLHQAELAEQQAQALHEQQRRLTADELIAILAHDLRNYLTPLVGRLELIWRRALQEGREQDLGDVTEARAAAGYLRALVDSLLDARRLEVGLFSLAVRPMNLAALARETAELLQSPHNAVQVEGLTTLLIEGDADRLRQVLANLLSNALQHSPPGAQVRLTIGVEHQGDKEQAVVTVRDQGQGIPPEVLPHLFERFQRGRSSKGLGLGLYVACQIAEAHGGTLEVTSQPGEGSTFRLRLPCHRPSGGSARQAEHERGATPVAATDSPPRPADAPLSDPLPSRMRGGSPSR